MKSLIIILIITMNISANSSKKIVIGTLGVIEPQAIKSKFEPFVSYLSKKLNVEVELNVDINYSRTISKISNGTYDFAFLGPIPYLIAKNSGNIELLASLETNHKPFFKSVIVARKDSDINSLDDIIHSNFAFGSNLSTLSFYVPAYILQKNSILDRLNGYTFLYSHDKVAKNVILGFYDVGSIKESVYKKYSNYLKVIYSSKNYYDFVFVANKNVPKKIKEAFKNTILCLENKEILDKIKVNATGFVESDSSNYQDLKKIKEFIDNKFKFKSF